MSVTVKPTVTNCSGTIWFTDLMLQEGPALTAMCHIPKDGSWRVIRYGSMAWFALRTRSSSAMSVIPPAVWTSISTPNPIWRQARCSLPRVLVDSGSYFQMASLRKMTLPYSPRCGNAPGTVSPSRKRAFINTAPLGTPSIKLPWRTASLPGYFLNYSR